MSSSAHPMNPVNVALVGATTLKGREVRDVLSERGFPSADCKLLDEDESLGQLDHVNDEAAFIQAVAPENLEGTEFAFLAAAEPYIARVREAIRDSGTQAIDLSYALESDPSAVLRAPWVESEQGGAPDAAQGAPVVVAHPAAVVLALLLGRLRRAAAISHASAVVCQPASEHGRRGLDELHAQTVNLLNLKTVPSAFFGTQSAFNLYAQSVESAHTPLPETEGRILRHFRAIAPAGLAAPALLLLQAPVFHGYVCALYVETAATVSAPQMEAALAGPHVSLLRGANEFPSNVSIAGSAEILVSLRADAGAGSGFWLFAAVDNLRVSAVQAVECAEQMLRARLRGQVQ